MKRMTMIGLACAAVICGMPAWAQETPPPPPMPMPGDAPAMGAPPRRMPQPLLRVDVEHVVERQFARLDTNGDGVVTRAEIDAARAERQARMRGPGPDGAGDGAPPPPPGADGGPPRRGHGMRGGLLGVGGMGWFERVDADHDGRVTLAEAKAAALAAFDAADTNHDGIVTVEERRAAMRAMMRGGPDRMPADAGEGPPPR